MKNGQYSILFRQRKELLNQSRKSAINRDNDPRARGDSCQYQISSVSTIYQNENQPPKKRSSSDSSLKKQSNSSRIQVWLKKSWITVKHKNEDEGKTVGQMLKLCQNAAKKVVTGAWKCK